MLVLMLLATWFVAARPGSAAACSCAPVTTADMVESAEIVFVGEEVSRTVTNDRWPPVAVTFAVAAAYKGDVGTEVTVWTGGGDADCGVGPTTGLVGITAATQDGKLSINICGSLHSPAAIAALLEPIEVAGGAVPDPPGDCCGSGWLWWSTAAAVGVGVVALGVARARRRDWQDGWNSS